jgi:cell division septation protein DedD
MKKPLLIAFLGLLMLGFVPQTRSAVVFYNGSFAEMQAQALRENRPYFVNFYTSWCSPCSQMNEATFVSESLADYVAANYLAYAADAESFADGGLDLADAYKVMFYPTILIFSPEGELVHKSTGYKQASELLAMLKQYRFNATAKPATSVPVAVAIPKAEPTKPAPPKAAPPSQSPAGQGLFHISVSSQASAGFGVQIGVFSDFANVLKEAQSLEAAFHDNVLVHVVTLQEKTAFRIILGPFSTRGQADSYKASLKQKEGREGMVVDLRSFK